MVDHAVVGGGTGGPCSGGWQPWWIMPWWVAAVVDHAVVGVVRAAKYAQAPAAPSSAVAPEVHALSVCRQLAALCSIFVAMRGAPLHECKRARAHHRGWDRH